MKKITVFILTFLLLFSLCSCGDNTSDVTASEPLTLDIIMSKIEESVELPAMITLTEENISDFFGIEKAEYSDCYASICEDSLRKDQIVMFKATDSDSAEAIAQKLNNARQNALDETENYLPEQFSLVSGSSVMTDGLYVTFFVSENADIITKTFKELI